MWWRDRYGPKRPTLSRLLRLREKVTAQQPDGRYSTQDGTIHATATIAGARTPQHCAVPAHRLCAHIPLRIAILLAAALTTPLLSACSFGPVYTPAAQTQSALTLRYADPTSRLEQVFYQELARELGRASDPAAPVLSVALSTSETRVGLSSITSPVADYQVVATATWTLHEQDTVISTGKRTAVSGYLQTGQAFADDRAEANAEEQAVRAVAETVRLALLAELAGR